MKIICFTSSLTGGGAQHQISVLANLLSKRGYDVSVVTYKDYADRYQTSPKVKRIRISAKGSVLKQFFSICRSLWRLNADCIISFRSPVNFICLLSLFLRKKKNVIVGERNLTIEPSFREKINYNFLYYTAKAIVANSYSQTDYLVSLNKKWSKRVSTIINYTNLEKYNCYPIPKNELKKIGIFSRFSHQKNCLRLAKVINELKNKGYRNFCVQWYGDSGVGDLEYEQLCSYIRKYNIESYFELHPAVDNVQEEIRKFHIICLPSLYEGFSNSISEGICSGRPMLVSNVSDNSLMVKDGINGYLFNPTNVGDMVNAFEKMLMASYEELEAMGKNSRKIAEELFDEEKFVQSYINLINDIVK